jgi:hypothetical protein
MFKKLFRFALIGSFVAVGAAAPANAQQPAPKPAAAPAAPAAPAGGHGMAPSGGSEQIRPSPAAKVQQRVGLTDITVDYSSPGVKKRKIWGALVPHDKIWRTGANSSTKLTFSKNVTIGDKAVPAGTYSLLTIPSAKSWTFILNKATDIGGSIDEKYKQAEDVVRVTAKPKAIAPRERMTFIFADFTDDSVNLDLEWEKVRVSLPIKTQNPPTAQK